MPDDSSGPSNQEAGLCIREASPPDIDGLAEVEEAAFASDRLSRRSLAAMIRRPSAVILVATVSDRLAGYALVLFRRGSHAGRLYSIAVRPDAGGRGIASRLLAAAEAAARERGAQTLSLEVRSDNAAAVSLYERSGYSAIGRRDDYYEDGETALLYARPLRPQAPSASPRPLGRAA